MIIKCEHCGHSFGGPKTLELHRPQGRCLDPKTVDNLELTEAKVWRKRNAPKDNLQGLKGAEYWEMRRVVASERRVRVARWGIQGF